MDGWIKIHRSLLEWEWWDDARMVHALMYVLMRANPAPYRWHGADYEAGTFVTSLTKMAIELGISVHQTRLVLERMESTGEITVQSNNRHSLVRVCNWERFQTGTPNGTQAASNGHASGKQTATGEEIKNLEISPRAAAPACEDVQLLPETCLTFAQFWEMYGKKVDKEKCSKRFAKVPEKDREIITKVLPVYIASTPDVAYRKNPLTWLNGQCWHDEMQAQPDRQPQAGQQNGGQVLHDYNFDAAERGTGKQAWEA